VSATFTQQALMALLTPLSDNVTASPGLFGGAGGAVTQTATPSEAVLVTPAVWVIPGPSPTSQGPFLWTPGTSNQTVSWSAHPADATNPRIDLLVAQVNDPGSTTAAGDATYNIIAGTPAAVPVAPTTPADAVFIRQIRRNVGDTTITNARITGSAAAASLRLVSTAVTAPNKTNPKVNWGFTTTTTDSSGYVTVTHGLGSTPGDVRVQIKAPDGLSSYPWSAIVDTVGSTTFRVRFGDLTSVYVSDSVHFYWQVKS
jgi:hypothetical protein